MRKMKLFTWITVIALVLGTMVLPAMAADMDVVVEESFDDYAPGYAGASTLLGEHFCVDANAIGDGSVHIEENAADGNLHLKSQVFTQVYSTTPLPNGYTFSMDVMECAGDQNSSIFLRAPKVGEFPYYETDCYGGGNTSCLSGVVLNLHAGNCYVNIKSYDPTKTENRGIAENLFKIPLPDGVSFAPLQDYTNLRVEDDGSTMQIFIGDKLHAKIVMSNPVSGGYSDIGIADACFKTAVIYDGAGNELGTVTDTLIMAENAIVGWATRVSVIIVDNVYLAVPAAEETAPETDSATESETDPEASPETDPVTDSETAPVTDSESNAPIDSETDKTTEASTSTDTTPETTNEGEGGCSSALAGVSVLLMAASAAIALKKKH